ncbi:MAG TPA: NUDIX domain-containing protein [Candidatus Saccharimonadia bacterium]|nr:NUDIX domain-containing protein [Candidatus Saccharimonadia bacterium]
MIQVPRNPYGVIKRMKYVFAFGNQKHAAKLADALDKKHFTLIHILDERSDKPGYAKKPEALAKMFDEHYQVSLEVAAFVNFGRGTVIGGLENIARSWELIREKYPDMKHVKRIGPSYHGAKIFFNKALTYKYLKNLGIPTPETKVLEDVDPKEIEQVLLKEKFPFPAVLKATHLSGGQGMKLVSSLQEFEKAYNELHSSGLNEFVLSEFVSGPEASFVLLRLGDAFLRIPPSYKDHTTLELKHSDCKVKMAGIFREFEPIYDQLENIMRTEDISGLLYLQAVLQKVDGEYICKVIEGETRLTGSSPISFGALKGFNFYETLATWIASDTIKFSYENRLCVQYASYIHHGENDLNELLAKEWLLEAKHEKDLAASTAAEKPIMRTRISFIGDDVATLDKRLKEIEDILGNPQYGREVKTVLDKFKEHDPGLFYLPEKILEGKWGAGMRWEFYRSDYLPPRELCAAVFCLGIANDKVILTKNKRGWEMLGGHVESGESIEDALTREAQEEGGFTPQSYKVFGYRKIISSKPVPNRTGDYYPFPISYIPHFIATTELPVSNPSGEEVVESASFSLEEIAALQFETKEILEAGIEAYKHF